jgi:hypothetical protein
MWPRPSATWSARRKWGYRDRPARMRQQCLARAPRERNNDVRAVFWLQKAAAQGCARPAAAAQDRAAPKDGAWPKPGLLPGGDLSAHPLLAARLELAALFGLSRAEALLLDVRGRPGPLPGDRHPRQLRAQQAAPGDGRTAQERQALDRIVRLFENVDCGPGGPEGNYRQRLYRLRTLLPDGGRATTGPPGRPPERGKVLRSAWRAPGRRRADLAQISISPSNTVTGRAAQVDRLAFAGPGDRQFGRRAPSTRTGESSRPRRMPATTAAQAPVPQARVSPAPRSNTRSLT